MINGANRPWGEVGWLLRMASLKDKPWLVLGAISTQDRCISILRHAGTSYQLDRAIFLQIEDAQSKFSSISQARRIANFALFEQALGASKREVHQFELFEPILRLKKQIEAWTGAGKKLNVILDVSALPEQFYFPMLRWLVTNQAIENLVVTYMAAEKYTNEDLAYNARDWAQLPTFVTSQTPEPKVKHVVVGVGFLPFSLPDLLKTTYTNRDIKVSLIFPFPSAPSNVGRGWEFVRRIDQNMSLKDDRQIARINAIDISACFDRINSITRNGSSPAVFAPYGPKTHSVAMCLHAIKNGREVFYTHPSFYHPDYSTGIKIKNGVPSGHAYAVRLHGNLLY